MMSKRAADQVSYEVSPAFALHEAQDSFTTVMSASGIFGADRGRSFAAATSGDKCLR